jgi:hypothetical protein
MVGMMGRLFAEFIGVASGVYVREKIRKQRESV